MTSRRRLKVHLSTVLALTITSGGLMWCNSVEENFHYVENNKVLSGIGYGWPWPFYGHITSINGATAKLQPIFFWSGLLKNIFVNALVVSCFVLMFENSRRVVLNAGTLKILKIVAVTLLALNILFVGWPLSISSRLQIFRDSEGIPYPAQIIVVFDLFCAAIIALTISAFSEWYLRQKVQKK